MSSCISNSNKILIISAIALVLLIQLIVFLFGPMPPSGIDYHWRNEINAKKPDIVLIGSSPLRRVREDLLAKDLQLLTNKKYSILKLMEIHSGACYWQLLLKNQVCQSQDKDYAVGILATDNELTNQSYIFNGDGFREEMIAQQLERYDDPLHYRKWFPESKESSVRRLLREWRFYYLRKAISSDLLNYFVNNIFNKINHSHAVMDVLRHQFVMDEFHERFRYDDLWQKGMNYDFDGSLNNSFLPDIVALKKDFNINLFVVILPIRPIEDAAINQTRKAYYAKLKNYLELNGIKYISFFDNKEFNYDDFYDRAHLKNATKLTKMLAQQLIDKEIVK